jgi:carboxypeptidase C (cathepsin A)
VTWNTEAMIVFIDQPLGTPWAYSDYPGVNVSSTVQAGEMILEFFTSFYDLFPNMTSLPTSIFGESYAGHYVPYFAEQFHKNNIWGVPFKGKKFFLV